MTNTNNGIFKSIDCYLLFVPDLEKGIKLYSEKLGHEMLWKRDDSAGLKMPDSNTEIVLSTSLPPETDLLVESTDETVEKLLAEDFKLLLKPFDIPVGRFAAMLDPFGNKISFLDLSKTKAP